MHFRPNLPPPHSHCWLDPICDPVSLHGRQTTTATEGNLVISIQYGQKHATAVGVANIYIHLQ